MKRNNDQPISEVLKAFSEQTAFKDKLAMKKIETVWLQLYSSLVKDHTTKIYVKQNKVSIHINSSVLKKELLLNKHKILDQMNANLKEFVIEELEFR